MDRRDSIKSLLTGALAGTFLINGCKPDAETTEENPDSQLGDYGRTPTEKNRDEKLLNETCFNEHELATIAVLCDIILPANDQFGSATEAGVPEFIEFIAKDLPSNQLPVRGGLMWLDNRANHRFNKDFKSCADNEQMELVDEIAYPDQSAPDTEPGVKFFSLMRNLTLTGYYTTRMGLDDLGYKGNSPNVWDGVPEEVLKAHNMAYEKEWLDKCIDQSTRTEVAKWDAEGNLL